MALLPDYEDAPVIKEGFLCPVCLEDFPGINSLQAHFTSGIHDEKPHDGRGFDDDEPSVRRGRSPQTIGVTRGHSEYFSRIRSGRVNWYEEQTAKLLDRLDKLTTIDAPADEQKRLMEKQIVSWVADQDVPLCPSCAKSFNFTRRRHHCRVCGAIMCHQCSQFLEYDEARILVHSGEGSDDGHDETSHASLARTSSPLPNTSKNQSLLPSPGGFGALGSNLLKYSMRRGSTTSLLSAVSQSANKDATSIRVCFNCHVLLERRRAEVDEKRSVNLLTTYYKKLRERMEETELLVHDYYQICYSYSLGETKYDLQEAQALRVKLIRLSEEIDVISRKIGTFGVTDATPPPVTQIQLQTKIRLAATNFLKQYTLGLQSLPTKEDIDKNRQKMLDHQQSSQEDQQDKRKNNNIPPSSHNNSNNVIHDHR